MFKKGRIAGEPEYLVDFTKNEIDIKSPDKFSAYFFDFFVNFNLFLTYYYFISVLLLLSFGIRNLNTYFIIFFVFVIVFLCQTTCYYFHPNHKLMVKIQMMFEKPMCFFFFKKTEKTIELNNIKKVIIKTRGYFKYNFKFYGQSKKDLKTIEYKKTTKFLKRKIVIEFKQKTKGFMFIKGNINITNIEVING